MKFIYTKLLLLLVTSACKIFRKNNISYGNVGSATMDVLAQTYEIKNKCRVRTVVTGLFPAGLFLAGLFPTNFSSLGLFPVGLFPARSFSRQVFSPPVFPPQFLNKDIN